MKNQPQQKRSLGAGILLGALALSPVNAEDIEIYVGAVQGNEVNPNVLFILDNSGSMTDNSLDAPTPFNPATSYSGSYDSAYYYRARNAGLPYTAATGDKIAVADLQCQTGVTAIAATGIYAGMFLAWRVDTGDPAQSAWSEMQPLSAGAENVECFNDSGVHGNGGAGLYANDGTAGAWGTAAGEIDWNSRAEYHTFYSANFLNYKESPVLVSTTRYDTMIQVVNEFIRRSAQINAGLMWFTFQNGGFVDKEMVNLQTYSNRTDLLSVVNTPQNNTWTPLSETLYEAFLYFTGGDIEYGENSNPVGDNGSEESVNASRVASDYSKYQSPITQECQKNYIVLLSDGEPTKDNGVGNTIKNLPGFTGVTGLSNCDINGFGAHGKCLEELSLYMNKPPNDDLMSSLIGEQTVQTYTIAFDLGDSDAQDLLRETAEGASPGDPGGGGNYYEANSADALVAAFTSILTQIGSINVSFTSPSVSVNAFNRTINREFLYYTMFATDAKPSWEGNLKKYRVAFDSAGASYITDSTSSDPWVVSPLTGDFISTSESYWSDSVDGGIVLGGGIRDRMRDSLLASRNVWTDTGSSFNLTDSSNQVHESNASLTKALLSIPAATDDYRNQVLQWARGVDVDDIDSDSRTNDSRKSAADPLHSKPVVATYGGTESSPVQVVFFGTNNGYVHAIDEATGNEIFSFVPQEMLGRLPSLYENLATTSRPYGLDASVTLWTKDVNDNGVIEPAGGDHVYLYVGMRRGGRNYYALDVTRIKDTTPSADLMWKIVDGDLIAGSKGTSTTGAYAEMGQSWSKPVVRKIKIGSVEKSVLVVGGGYDTNQDNTNAPDGIGRALYFINAETGAREWWASSDTSSNLTLNDMDYSIPSAVAAHDIDGDKLLDRMYVGDMGGQLWRFDIENGAGSSDDLVKGAVIATLSDATATGARRFYYAPDIALLAESSNSYLTIILGSGYRSHPLNTATIDRLYMIKDPDIFSAPTTYPSYTEADLYDATSNDIGELTGTARQTAIASLKSKDGWYIRLSNGEKSLSAPLITGGVAIASTFEPIANTSSCDPPGGGNGYVYYLNLADGTPVFNFDGAGTAYELTVGDRRHLLAAPGIPPQTTLIVSTDDNGNAVTTVLHGKEKGVDPTANQPMKTFWHELME